MLVDLYWIAGAIIAVAILTTVILRFVFWPRTVHHAPSVNIGSFNLHWEEHDNCTAGSQWLSPDGTWGPIPKYARQMVEGGNRIEAPQANIRRCPDCQGGGWWRR